jgi:hypothetical protein
MKLVETDPTGKIFIRNLDGGGWLSAREMFNFDEDGTPRAK